jgi:hypothetical protein
MIPFKLFNAKRKDPVVTRREEGKKGRREEGKKGRREEGKKGRREEGKKGRREEGKKGREVFEKVHNHKNCIFLQPEIILFSCISPHKYSKYSYIKGSMPIYSNS